MRDIRRAIRLAEEAGHNLTITGEHKLAPIGPKLWFRPDNGLIVRHEEGNDLPFAIYDKRGELLGRTKLQRHARAFQITEQDVQNLESTFQDSRIPVTCVLADDIGEDDPQTVTLLISRRDYAGMTQAHSDFSESTKDMPFPVPKPWVQVFDIASQMWCEVTLFMDTNEELQLAARHLDNPDQEREVA